LQSRPPVDHSQTHGRPRPFFLRLITKPTTSATAL
jgi:hypothetical protein